MRPSLLLAALALTGCAVEEAAAPLSHRTVALYGTASETMLTPYPSDRYTVPDASRRTGLRVHLAADTTADPIATAYGIVSEELNEMDGFSTVGGVIVSFSGPLDVHGIIVDELADPPIVGPARDADDYKKPDSPLLLVDVDPASPERGARRGLVPRWWAQAKDDYYTTDEFTLIAQPATPLLPGTRYMFAVTSALKAADGSDLGRSPETEALLRGDTGGAYADAFKVALEAFEGATSVSRDKLRLATMFTTASMIDETLAFAERAREEKAPPALLSPWEVETPITANDHRIRYRVVFETPEYRRPLPDGKWEIQSGAPVVQKKVGLEAFLAFSDGTKSGPRPVVIFAHGLGGDKDGNWGTAERLADLNAAVIAIDSPEHGSRSSNPASPFLATFSFFGVDPAGQTFDIGRARDNFRQMASDQLELVRFINSLGGLDLLPDGAPDGVPDLDVSRILYIGHSFGSVQGPAIFALAPEIRQATWNVGGDGLMTLLRDSGTFSLLVNTLRPPGTPDGALGRFFAVTQAIVDPGDPINYARFGALEPTPGVPGWAPRDILLQEVVDDNVVPNSTSEALARAAGLTLVDAIRPISGLKGGAAPISGNLAGGATGAIVQFNVMNGDQPAEHGGLIFSPEAQAEYVQFFQTGLAGGHATVAPAYPHK